jgi:2'-5' RNA ligase
MSEQRLFFALWPDPVTRQQLVRLRADIPGIRGRPTHPEDLHVTLVFLGAVDPDRRGCAERAADSVTGPGFDLPIDRIGHWPRPRILWCGCEQTPAPLLGLVSALRRSLLGCGFEPERRRYAAHVTLARNARPVAVGVPPRALNWTVRDYVLAASRLDRGPPHYQVLRRWPLAPASAAGS